MIGRPLALAQNCSWVTNGQIVTAYYALGITANLSMCKSQVEIVAGATSRREMICIFGLSPQGMGERLLR